jgi:hypothetical protein
MNLKNIAPVCAVLWLASACQKPYEPALMENYTLLSAVHVYGENVTGDTANYRLNYDAGQRYTGFGLYLNSSTVSYFTNNTTDYDGPWQIQRLAVNKGMWY